MHISLRSLTEEQDKMNQCCCVMPYIFLDAAAGRMHDEQHPNASANPPGISIAIPLQMISGMLLNIGLHSKGHPSS